MNLRITHSLRGMQGQRGVSLVIVLVLLVATSLLGIAVLRSSAMQERMSANMRDRGIAFQAAEAALRYAQEGVLGAVPADPEDAWDIREPLASDCVVGLSVCPAGSDPVWSSVPEADFDFRRAGLAAAPEYWIEYLGMGPAVPGGCEDTGPARELNCQNPIYRVTARSRAEGRADVVLQANIISRIPVSGS
ncbi:pilus assembly PilX family protein [Luteimonas arsenica]|uniref:pilus assembly PilX family protein n=1 Tax=Luteimonas arsenica TaxID=1586242 RepID=UPI001A9F5EB5|nr:PilX N-terminal domain-containing pilus assembly protein [Luteimonas arsenica]